VIDKLTARGFVPGFPLGRYYPGLENALLVACTEKTSKEQIGVLAEMLRGILV
jgi:glycine dehydrogenase subunit 1